MRRSFSTKVVRFRCSNEAARFVLDRMRAPDGRLRHMFMEGEASIPAYLDDYAFLIRGLVEVYETGFDPHYLERARDLVRIAAAERTGRWLYPP